MCPVLYENSNIYSSGKNSYLHNSVFPIEDLGILITGEIVSQSDAIIPAGSEAIFSINDTLPDMQASKISSDGSFAFLIDKYKSMEAFIDLKFGEEQLSNDYNVQVDEKFYYASGSRNSDKLKQFTNEDFSNSIKEETNRVIIQRAFGHLNPEGTDSLFNKPYSLQAFYGDPLIVVYPEEFIFLPNFGEIIREIIPRVRFKNNNSQCELIVTDVENSIKSNTPLVLMDGIPVKNICDLQMLNSDHIQRIEVQSGLRVVGNFLYNVKNQKSKLENTFQIPGYAYSPDFSVLYEGYISKGKTHPDFKNQLYWDPNIALRNNEKAEIEFLTSDELGEYIIDITGYTENGLQIHHQETFFVVQ